MLQMSTSKFNTVIAAVLRKVFFTQGFRVWGFKEYEYKKSAQIKLSDTFF